MSSRWLALALLAAALLGWPCAATAQQTCAYQARLDTDLPCEQAEVELLGPGAPLTTRPDSIGLFRFDGLTPGIYQVTVTFPDGPVTERYVTVRPDAPRDRIVVESMRRQMAGSALWTVLAALLGVALGSAIVLYGRVRDREPVLPWGARPRRTRRAAVERVWPMISATVAWCLSWLLVATLAPELQPFLLVVAAPVSAVLGALLGAALVLVGISRRPRPTVAVGTLAMGIGLSILCRFGPGVPDLSYLPAGLARLLWLGVGLGLLAWTTAAGWLLSLGCRQTSYVIMAALVGAVLDIYLVFFGHTGHVMTSGSSVAAAVRDVGLLPWPVFGSDLVHGVVGWGDYVFLALFLAAAHRFDLGLMRNFWAQAAALTVGFIMGHVLSALGTGLPGLPALPFMAAFLVLANRGRLGVSAADRRRIVSFVGALTLILACMAGWRMHRAPREREDIEVEAGRAASAPSQQLPWTAAQLAESTTALRLLDGPLVDGQRLARFELVTEVIEGRPVVVRGYLARPAKEARRRVLWLGDMAQPVDLPTLARLAAAGDTCLAPDLHPALDSDWDSDLGAWPCTRLIDGSRSPRTGLAWHQGLAAWRCSRALAALPASTSGQVVVAADAGAVPVLPLAAAARDWSGLVLADIGTLEEAQAGELAAALERCGTAYREAWQPRWSPERWAPKVSAPVLQVQASNQSDCLLPAATRLHGRLAGRKVFRLLANESRAAGLPALTDLVVQWLADGLATPDPLRISARGEGDRLHISLTGGSSHGVGASRLWLSVSPWTNDNWPGRWWTSLTPHQPSAEVRLSAPAESVAVVAEAQDARGQWFSSGLVTYQVADLRLRLGADSWQSPEIALLAGGRPAFRLTPETDARGVSLGVGGDGALLLSLPANAPARSVGLITNHVQPLRRLGGQARALLLDLDAGNQGGAVDVELGALVDGRRHWFAATATPRGAGRQRLAVDLRRLEPLDRGARLDWSQVDALRLRSRRNGAGSLTLYGLSLVDGDESVHEVTER